MKDPWLIHGLYDWHCGRDQDSPRVLETLLRCADSEPHDRHLLDRICEGLKAQGKSRWDGTDEFPTNVVGTL